MSSEGIRRPGEVVVHRGTAFVADCALYALEPDPPPPPFDLPQFSSPRIDASWVSDCFKILAQDVGWGSDGKPLLQEPKRGLRGVAIPGTRRLRNRIAVQLWVFSEEFCQLLVKLTDERLEDIARRWNLLLYPFLPEKNSSGSPRNRIEYRVSILRELRRLAQIADSARRQILLRCVYRSRRLKP